jgi:hypothetical protein
MTARKQDRPLTAQLASLSDGIVKARQRARECELGASPR